MKKKDNSTAAETTLAIPVSEETKLMLRLISVVKNQSLRKISQDLLASAVKKEAEKYKDEIRYLLKL